VLHRNAICALALLCFSSSVVALEIGFESQLTVNASDNVTGANKGQEVEGQVGNVQFGVFGEQTGTRLKGGFAGELYSTRRLDDSDSNFSSVTQFIGAAEFQITPRSFSWYVGDILGTVRADDGLQSIDPLNDERRNIFVTGPQFVYRLDSFSRVNANVYYVNQTQDDVTLQSLINANANWSFDTDRGNTWGAALNNIFTDNPGGAVEGDFNRFSLAGTWARSRGRNTFNARLGGTRYDTDSQSINGANAQFSLERQLSAQTLFGLSFTRDLRDQTLTLVQSIITDGAGAQAASDGLFDETSLKVNYGLISSKTKADIYAGFAQSEFRLISNGNEFVSAAANLEDRTTFSAGASLSQDFTPRLRVDTGVNFSQQDFNNRSDNTQSLLGEAQLAYRLSRSFEAQLGYRVNFSDGMRTQTDAEGVQTLEKVDSVENRIIFGLRWAPPTRATKNLTFQLKSLLQ